MLRARANGETFVAATSQCVRNNVSSFARAFSVIYYLPIWYKKTPMRKTTINTNAENEGELTKVTTKVIHSL